MQSKVQPTSQHTHTHWHEHYYERKKERKKRKWRLKGGGGGSLQETKREIAKSCSFEKRKCYEDFVNMYSGILVIHQSFRVLNTKFFYSLQSMFKARRISVWSRAYL